MKTWKDGRARVEVRDIDIRAGIKANRWFWMFFAAMAALVLLWPHP